ncbi:MAG TPA: hypothetical protein VFX28_23790 [Methylomirabilota bacterium]|nr:hypothetical protein [Methylomirabilota bacterium]
MTYLAGESSLDSFDEWFTEATWNIHQDGDEAAKALAYAIELRLAEHSSGHLSDSQLDEELTALLGRYTVSVVLDAVPHPAHQTAATATRLAPIPASIAA